MTSFFKPISKLRYTDCAKSVHIEMWTAVGTPKYPKRCTYASRAERDCGWRLFNSLSGICRDVGTAEFELRDILLFPANYIMGTSRNISRGPRHF